MPININFKTKKNMGQYFWNEKLSTARKFNIYKPIIIWPYMFHPFGPVFTGSTLKGIC
jgi:hypothetical protein